MTRETILLYEIVTHCAFHMMASGLTTGYRYAQSRGEARPQSSNPDDPLLLTPSSTRTPSIVPRLLKYLVIISRWENTYRSLKTVTTLLGPESESGEDILEFFKNTLTPGYDSTGTVKMGKMGDVDAAVDCKLHVFGIGSR